MSKTREGNQNYPCATTFGTWMHAIGVSMVLFACSVAVVSLYLAWQGHVVKLAVEQAVSSFNNYHAGIPATRQGEWRTVFRDAKGNEVGCLSEMKTKKVEWMPPNTEVVCSTYISSVYYYGHQDNAD